MLDWARIMWSIETEQPPNENAIHDSTSIYEFRRVRSRHFNHFRDCDCISSSMLLLVTKFVSVSPLFLCIIQAVVSYLIVTQLAPLSKWIILS